MNYHLAIVCLLVTVNFYSCNSPGRSDSEPFWGKESNPETIGRRITEELLQRPYFKMYELPHATSVHYAEACAGFGAARLAGLLGDTTTLRLLTERYIKVIEDNIPNTANHVDANVYGILPLELYMQTGNERFYRQGIALADGQWANPRPDGMTNQTRYWIDDVYMIAILQVQAYRATGRAIYLECAAFSVSHYLARLQQPNGLFHHGASAPFFWGRGNGWVAAGLAELISELPETNPHYPVIIDAYKKMMEALLRYQTPDGMWRQLIDVEDSWVETSSTAMFGFAILQGVTRGILTDPAYTKAYQKAWLALPGYLNENAQLTEVCVGTGKSDDINYYLERPRIAGDLHGQAPMLWFAFGLLEQARKK